MILKKIESCSAHSGVIGLGYVGLPLMVAIANAGFRVTGIDICQHKLERLKNGISDVPDVPNSVLESFIKSGQIQVTDDFSVISELDTVNICVPTPLSENNTPDIQYISAAVEQIAEHLREEQLIILESTTYPGTTEEVVLPMLQPTVKNTTQSSDTQHSLDRNSSDTKGTLQVGKDFYLAYSPERIEPGNSTFYMTNTPKVIGGVTPKCTQIAKAFYEQYINKTHTVSSPRIAEMVKLLENTFRSVNIGLINEVALICDRMGMDVWEIIDAAATKPFGFMPFYPGPGPGGHCIPIDPHYLSWKARTYQYHARFIELASEINRSMPKYVFDKVIHALNRQRKSLNGSRILVIGVAYKKDIGDTRESPAFEVMRLMLDNGAKILYHDPHVSNIILRGEDTYHSETLTTSIIESVDCVVILTDHSSIDYEFVVRYAGTVVDTRNATRSIQNSSSKIIKL